MYRPYFARSYKREISKIKTLNTVDVIGKTFLGNEIYLCASLAGPSKPSVLITGGVHGNEPSNVYFLIDQILTGDNFDDSDLNIYIIPCVNPDGFDIDTRENYQGIDVNRDFKDFKSEEARTIRDWLSESRIKFDLAIDLHESGYPDKETEHTSKGEEACPDTFYMWELTNDSKHRVSNGVMDFLQKQGFPTCNWVTIFGDRNNNGLIRYPEDATGESYKDAATLDTYIWNNKIANCAITTETCVNDPLEYRHKLLSKAMWKMLDNLDMKYLTKDQQVSEFFYQAGGKL